MTRRRRDDAVRRTNQFLLVTAGGWLGAAGLALIAALVGEGQEWMFVAPFFVVMGAVNLYIALK